MNDSSTTSLPRLPDYSRPTTAAAILGTAVLSGGVTVAIYSLFFAAGNPYAGDIDSEETLSVQLGVFSTAIGTAALLILAVTLRWSANLRAAGLGNPPVVIMSVVVAVEILICTNLDIPSTVDRIFDIYAAYPQLPMAVAAWYLVILGSVLVLGATLAPPARRALSTRSGAILAAIGVLVCATAAGLALRAGDDDRVIDHRTAAATAVAPVPNRLGSEKFRINLKDSRRVVVGGNGFFIGSKEGITAYDGATGTPRWHYLRQNVTSRGVQHSPDSMVSVPSENVLATYWENLGWIGFDASTGERLWTDSEFSRGRREHGPTTGTTYGDEPAPLLVRVTDCGLARYEARSGRLMWAHPRKTFCRSRDSKIAFTSHAIYRMSAVGTTQTTISAFDLATGATIAERSIPNPDSDRTPELSVVDDVVSIDWRDKTAGHLHFDSPDNLRTATVTEPAEVIAADPSTGTIVTRSDRDAVTVSETRVPARSRPVEGLPSYWSHKFDALLLTDELVVSTEGLRTWKRTDLTETTPDHILSSCSLLGASEAPGVVLIRCGDSRSTPQIVGFAP
ncbi:PQQ-binding-like beta-propeller repeat protein [Nocardia sp. NPDC058518]|uniref:outer membrane protein assembly factor BamB family protein n=1 Tax=Nocardia sp. NPDC058518 TaxID=3346534 RepID=UPI00365EBD9F